MSKNHHKEFWPCRYTAAIYALDWINPLLIRGLEPGGC